MFPTFYFVNIVFIFCINNVKTTKQVISCKHVLTFIIKTINHKAYFPVMKTSTALPLHNTFTNIELNVLRYLEY